jgi:carboxyl-terminal processing protease
VKDSSSALSIPLFDQLLALFTFNRLATLSLVSLTSLLVACGGSGGGGNGGGNPLTGGGGNKDVWQAGSFKASTTFGNLCEAPRVGRSEFTGINFPDKKGTRSDEKNFLRSWNHETYLWFSEVTDITPLLASQTPQDYFSLLKTNLRTSSGALKDNFHWYEPTADAEAWSAGVTYGYGLNLKVESWNVPRTIRVAYTDTGSAAAAKGVKRGAKIIAIDGLSVSSVNINTLIEQLFPSSINAVHEFEILEPGQSVSRKVTLESRAIDTDSVSVAKVIEHSGSKVGYMQFNTFIPAAQDKWVTAINSMKNAGVSDLILDMRYNGGGYISVAAQAAYMIAGSNTDNKVFFQDVANSKMPKEDPWSFLDTGLYGLNNGLKLPTLNLQRVYVLSTGDTCSASELVINSLRGIGVGVYLIGDTTCGKPYGYVPTPNCGTTYYTIQFKSINAKGFGEYSDGFVPSSTDNNEDRVKGCKVSDDLTHELGDPQEALLATALQFRTTGSCSIIASNRQQKTTADTFTGELVRPDVREIMIR